MGKWNELTGHPKDRGKNRPNLRTNSLQQGENDADCVAVNLRSPQIEFSCISSNLIQITFSKENSVELIQR
jgi:hypothetical protein